MTESTDIPAVIGRLATRVILTASLLTVPFAQADSTRAKCGFSGSADRHPATTSTCMFSQRQGYISVRMAGGQDVELSPTGDQPGNYRDQDGRAVYRQSGLGDRGQLFKLPDSYLYVIWDPIRYDCPAADLATPGKCLLGYGTIRFDVYATTGSSLNQLRIQPDGLAGSNSELTEELDGSAYRAEVADLDANGWPELYVYASSAGSGSYGSLVAYAVNNGKSLTPIYLPPLEHSQEAMAGYMGHDEFAVVENRLVRRFPVYLEGDTNAQPSGGTRQLQYRLEAGEAGWVLQLDRVVDY